jgi:hypothetical protein
MRFSKLNYRRHLLARVEPLHMSSIYFNMYLYNFGSFLRVGETKVCRAKYPDQESTSAMRHHRTPLLVPRISLLKEQCRSTSCCMSCKRNGEVFCVLQGWRGEETGYSAEGVDVHVKGRVDELLTPKRDSLRWCLPKIPPGVSGFEVCTVGVVGKLRELRLRN